MISIRKVSCGYLVRIRADVPPVFIGYGPLHDDRIGIARYLEKMWEYL